MQASDQAITYGRHIRALATLGIPIIVGQLGTIIQGLADTIMVGHFSAHSLAAAGFVNNIMVLVLIFALGYSYAITPVIGPMHARGEFENAGKALKAGLQVNGALGMVLFLLMGTLYFFLGHMGQPEELLPEIRPYYIVVVLSIPIQSLFNAFKQFFDSIGNTDVDYDQCQPVQHRGKLPVDLRYRPLPATRIVGRRHLYHPVAHPHVGCHLRHIHLERKV